MGPQIEQDALPPSQISVQSTCWLGSDPIRSDRQDRIDKIGSTSHELQVSQSTLKFRVVPTELTFQSTSDQQPAIMAPIRLRAPARKGKKSLTKVSRTATTTIKIPLGPSKKQVMNRVNALKLTDARPPAVTRFSDRAHPASMVVPRCTGVYMIVGDRGGGIWVHPSLNELIPEQLRKADGCYHEDGDAKIPEYYLLFWAPSPYEHLLGPKPAWNKTALRRRLKDVLALKAQNAEEHKKWLSESTARAFDRLASP